MMKPWRQLNQKGASKEMKKVSTREITRVYFMSHVADIGNNEVLLKLHRLTKCTQNNKGHVVLCS